MKRLLDFFYRRSLPVRLFILLCLCLVTSGSLAFYGLWHLAQTWRHIQSDHSLAFDSHGQFLRQELSSLKLSPASRFLLQVSDLQESLGKTLPVDNTFWKTSFSTASLSSDLSDQCEKLLRDQAGLTWVDVLAFAGYRRSASQTLTIQSNQDVYYTMFQHLYTRKMADPTFSVTPGISLLLKHSTLTGWTGSTLIAALIELSCTAVIDRGLQSLYLSKSISGDEARQILAEMAIADQCRLPIRAAFETEIRAMHANLGRLRSSSPWGYFILTQVCGEPAMAFETSILQAQDQRTATASGHMQRFPFYEKLGIVPFVHNYIEDAMIVSAKRAIIRQELAWLAGSAEETSDPFSGGQLRPLDVNGTPSFYSVGPNCRDDLGKEDDIILNKES